MPKKVVFIKNEVMKRVYFAISYSKRKLFDIEIKKLQDFFYSKNIELFVFVDHYNFKPNQEVEMMEKAFEEIDHSDVFVAELSTKAIGVGIEMGYAYAKGKPVIYLRKVNSEYSTTSAGCATSIIEYENAIELITKLSVLYPPV